ncbi:MAG: hypothetical protein OES23_03575 [Nitrosopumilus sp.]|jgi:hypothetical protein|nr:hypothetical protein [Nitrosopumilus sp.]
MSKRISLILTDKVISKLRKIQAVQIEKTNSSVSFSHVINEILEKALKI